ncbi:carboxypeptidase regulatory-like domain-containing protein [Hamadaea sp. NPDC051192]|uniref:MSCRAMM family protein n=1 Tax=Hamadaea sp. NPDC051192 TaxID=3154940 RepID=UPI003443769A
MRRTAAIATFTLLAGLLTGPSVAAAAAPAKPVTTAKTTNAAATATQTATTQSSGVLQGTVRDATTGQPLPGACVDVVTAEWLFFEHECADQAGHYRIENYQAGSFHLQASAAGYAPVWWTKSATWLDSPIISFDSGTKIADFVLTPVASTGTVSGRITRQDGSAAGLATVRLSGSTGTTASVTTRLDGGYAVAGLPTGEYSVSIGGSGYPEQWVPGTRTPADAVRVKVDAGVVTTVDEQFLTLSPAPALTLGTLAGTVRDRSGSPIAGATVTGRVRGGVIAETATDAEGKYEIRDVPVSMPIYLRASAADRATAWFPGASPVPTAAVSAGTSTVITDVILRSGSGAIQGNRPGLRRIGPGVRQPGDHLQPGLLLVVQPDALVRRALRDPEPSRRSLPLDGDSRRSSGAVGAPVADRGSRCSHHHHGRRHDQGRRNSDHARIHQGRTAGRRDRPASDRSLRIQQLWGVHHGDRRRRLHLRPVHRGHDP